MEARRAVSTVPPITTSFYEYRLEVERIGGAPPAWCGEIRDWLTKVSVIALELTPKGDSRLETACMVEEGTERKLWHGTRNKLLILLIACLVYETCRLPLERHPSH